MTSQNDLAYRLVQRAARRAPTAVAERLQEEWSADLATRNGTLSRLQLAINCWWATGVITRDLAVPHTAAVTIHGNTKALLGDSHFDLPQLSRRTVTLLAIAGIHLLVIYGFASGLAQKVIRTVTPQTHMTITQESRPLPTPPPIAMTRIVVDRTLPSLPVLPEITFPADDKPRASIDTSMGTNLAPTGDSPSTQPAVHRVDGGPGAGFPSTDDFYPPAARRWGETGATTVQVCVDILGRLTAAPVVVAGSGSRSLDDGALSLARAGSGHYRPTTENGRPVGACYTYRIRFRLTD